MWAYESVFYQFYPLGMTKAPFENDGVLCHRILQVLDYIPHLKKLGINAVYFCPVFESDTHGYNTRDYKKIDTRLGTNEDFVKVCNEFHKSGIKIILDGVFNHVGRGFFAFLDVMEKKQDSRYKDWFYLDFNGNSPYNDGFWYEGWEGNYDLVKINLSSPEVRTYFLESIKLWIDLFGIDGLRLDVAYMVDRDFLRLLRSETRKWKDDFFLVGEILGGDYKDIMNPDMCHSATNYECYKGIYSSLNSHNLFEIIHSLLRQFGPEDWTLYKDLHLLSFVDNHDVTRIASNLTDSRHLPLAYAIMFGMPGIPSIYYGSEFCTLGHKNDGDQALRPYIENIKWNDLCDYISKLINARNNSKALNYGNFHSLLLENEHCVFERSYENERILVALNITGEEYIAHFNANCKKATDLITGNIVEFNDGLRIPAYTAMYLLAM